MGPGLQAAHLFHTLALGHVFIPHTHSGVQKTFEEVPTVDPHQVGSLVSIWQGTWGGMRKGGQEFEYLGAQLVSGWR